MCVPSRLLQITNHKYMQTHKRPSWDEYFMEITNIVGERGTCDRGRCGAIVTKNNRTLATGYAGSPQGMPHCDDAGHEIHEVIEDDGTHSKHCIRTTHAEQNAICQAARMGISIDGGTLYCKMEPCYTCAKMIVNCGIKRVVCAKRYHAAEKSRNLFEKAGVKLEVLSKEEEEYKDK